MDPFQRRFLSTWQHHWGKAGIRRVLVAVSGGADSVVLLRVLASIASEVGLELAVAHFNHCLRGKASNDDQAWVSRLADTLNLPLIEGAANLETKDSATRESLEMKARRLRHGFLAQSALEWRAEAIALAHHADDQAEGFLIRLLRGAGGAGLGGMRWQAPSPADRRIPLLRPLLGESKDSLLEEARARGWEFREDASNQDPSILRNRIRRELLPLLESDYQPGIREILLRTGELLSDEADFVEDRARSWISAVRRTRFDRLHPAVQRAVIRIELWKLGQEAGFDLVEKLRTQTAPVTVAPDRTVARELNGVVRAKATPPPPPSPNRAADSSLPVHFRGKGGRIVLVDSVLEWRRLGPQKRRARRRNGEEWLNFASIGTELRVRHWRSGDRFQPLGMSQAARLQNLFVNRKVPADQRRQLWVMEALTGPPAIVWVEGFPPGERFKVPTKSGPGTAARRILALRIVR